MMTNRPKKETFMEKTGAYRHKMITRYAINCHLLPFAATEEHGPGADDLKVN